MKKKLLSALLAICLALMLSPTAYAVSDSGSCGTGLTWSYDGGILTIRGSGSMDDYDQAAAPWYDYLNQIQTVRIEYGVTGIGNNAFYGCDGLKNVVIPDSVAAIGQWAFGLCESLTGIKLPGSVSVIRTGTFYGSGLTGITLPEGVSLIDGWAFQNSAALATVTLPKSLNTIGSGAFSGCAGLTSVYYAGTEADLNRLFISTEGGGNDMLLTAALYLTEEVPAPTDTSGYCGDQVTWEYNGGTLTIRGTGPMYDYTGSIAEEMRPWSSYYDDIQTVWIGEGVTAIGSAAFCYCRNMTGITIPGSVASIGEGAFIDCAGITDITIPDGVTAINSNTFADCANLTSVTIPASVTRIDVAAFMGCGSLSDVHYGGSELDWNLVNINNDMNANAPLLNAAFHYAVATAPATDPDTAGNTSGVDNGPASSADDEKTGESVKTSAGASSGFPTTTIIIIAASVAGAVVVAVAVTLLILLLKKKKKKPTPPLAIPIPGMGTPIQGPAAPVPGPAPDSAASQGFKFCTQCGAKLPAATKFCPKCGKPLNS